MPKDDLEKEIEEIVKQYGPYLVKTEVIADLARLVEEREGAARKGLFKMTRLTPEAEGVEMQYLGAYILKWDGETRLIPEVGFVEVD